MSKEKKKLLPEKKGNRFYLDEKSKPESLLFGTIPSFFRTIFLNKKNFSCDINEWSMHHEIQLCSFEPVITWVGHATFLIQIGGINILTDPIFGTPSWIFKRCLPIVISINQLPPIDLVLLSHNHRDHMDSPSLYALEKQNRDRVSFFVPQGDKRWFDIRGFKSAHEFMWWDKKEKEVFGDSTNKITCTFLPASHWSQRGLFDKNKSLWGSWMIQWQDNTVYFAGDTAYSQHFEAIADEFNAVDIALMPVGPCEPRSWMERSHISSEEAGQAFLDLNADHFVPMHWGTFSFGSDSFSIPIDRLKMWWEEKKQILDEKKLHIVKVGQKLEF